MTKELDIFTSAEFGTLRTIEENGKIMFVASDVAKMLGYVRPADAVTAHCKGSVKYRLPTNGGVQEVKIISEGDVYRLIAHSKLPAAEKFESWVFDEVLHRSNNTVLHATENIPMSIENNEIVVSSRQIAENFGKMHKHVLDAIENIKAENSALTSMFYETAYTAGTGKKYKMYLMNRDGFSLLAMGFTGREALEWKLKYINAFNKMEHQLVNENALALPNFNNPAEAARAWANEYEAKQKALARVEEMKTKVLFAEAVESSKTSILVGELAKIIKQNGVDIGEKRFFAWLRDNGYLISRKSSDWNMPTQRSMKLGLFEIKERNIFNPDGSVRITKTPKVTGKGQTYFINKFLNETA